MTGHGKVTEGSVGQGFSAIDFSIASPGSVTFLAYCGISSVVFVLMPSQFNWLETTRAA